MLHFYVRSFLMMLIIFGSFLGMAQQKNPCDPPQSSSSSNDQKPKQRHGLEKHAPEDLYLGERMDKVELVFDALKNNPDSAIMVMRSFFPGSPFLFGRQLQKEGHLDLSMRWFLAMVKHHSGCEKSEYFYGKAFLHFRRGEYELALNDSELLFKGLSSQLTQARTHYLRGMVYSVLHEFEKSNEAFSLGEQSYQELGIWSGVYVCIAGRAEVAITQNNAALAQELLKSADEARLKSPTPMANTWLLELGADLHFLQADYNDFLSQAKSVEAAYLRNGNEAKVLWIRIKMALATALSGDFLTAYDMAKENDSVIQEKKDTKAAHYNNLTRILYRRCSGIETKTIDDSIKAWCSSKKGRFDKRNLLKLHALVHSVDCASLGK